MAVEDRDRVAGAGNDALDERLADSLRSAGRTAGGDRPPGSGCHSRRSLGVGAGRRVEHDDVADARVVDQAVGEDPLADVQRRLHRAARDPVRLDDERLDQQRQPDGDRDRDHQLDQRLHRRLACLRGGSGASAVRCGRERGGVRGFPARVTPSALRPRSRPRLLGRGLSLARLCLGSSARPPRLRLGLRLGGRLADGLLAWRQPPRPSTAVAASSRWPCPASASGRQPRLVDARVPRTAARARRSPLARRRGARAPGPRLPTRPRR